MLLYDQHTHSLHSHERACLSYVEEMCRGAMERGMSGIAVTDHYDLGRKPAELVTSYIRSSIEEVQAVREKLGDRFYLALGIELGEGHQGPEESAAAAALGPFDIVLGSLHNVSGQRDFSAIGKDFPDKRALFSTYLQEQIQMARWGGFDVVSHLTYPFRYYMLGEGCPAVEEFEEELRTLFAILAQSGKGIEVNTSGLYRPEHGRTMPGLWELKLWRECGGEIVTVGSDAHQRCHAGCGIREGAVLLREAGFRYQARFEGRRPRMIPL